MCVHTAAEWSAPWPRLCRSPAAWRLNYPWDELCGKLSLIELLKWIASLFIRQIKRGEITGSWQRVLARCTGAFVINWPLFCSSGHHGWTFAKITWHLSVMFMIVMLIFDEAWVSHSTAVQISCVPSKIDSIKRKTLMLEVYIYILSWPVQGTHSTFKGQVYTVDKIKAIFSEDTVSFYDLIRPCCSWNAIIKLQSYDITTAWLVGCNDSPGAASIMIF